MANRIKMAVEQSIVVLWRQGWSHRAIAKALGIHRETVSRHVREAQAANAAGVPAVWESVPDAVAAGRDGPDNSKPATVTAGNLEAAGPKPATVTAGNLEVAGPKPATVTAGNLDVGEPSSEPPARGVGCNGDSGQQSKCESFRAVIDEMLELGLTAQRIYQDLVADHAFTGSYSSVKRFVRHRTASSPLPFRRMESLSSAA